MIGLISEVRKSFVKSRSTEILNRYPAVTAAVFLSAGLWIAHVWELRSSPWLLALIPPTLFALVCIWKGRSETWLWCAVGALFLFLGLQLGARHLVWGADFQPTTSKCLVHATVVKTLSTGQNFRALVVDSGHNRTEDSGLPGNGRLTVRDNPVPLGAGDRIGFQSRIRKPSNRGNPGEYDWEMDCRHNGILWLCAASGPDSITVLSRGATFRPNALVFRTREAMTKFLDQHSGVHLKAFLDQESINDVKAILKGVIVGDLGEIREAVRTSFNNSGLIHQLSASGVHVGIVVILTLLAVKVVTRAAPDLLVWLPLRKLGALFSIPAMITYCLLVGARVPAIRSTLMGLVVCLAILMDRRWNSMNSLALAALLILLLYPLSLFTISFQLSFAAVGGIFILVSPVMNYVYGKSESERAEEQVQTSNEKPSNLIHQVLRWGVAAVLTSLAATLAVTPLVLEAFHSFPVYTLVANLSTDVMLTGALGLGLFASVIGPFAPEVGSLILLPAELLVHWIVRVAQFFAELPFSTIRVVQMGTLEFLAALACVGVILVSMRKPSAKAVVLASIAAMGLVGAVALSVSPARYEKDVKVVFLNVGKGDAAFIQARGCAGLLIDGGVTNRYFDSGRGIVVPFLRWTGKRSLDGVVMTHPQMDHMGGLLTVVSEMPPDKFFWNPVKVRSAYLDGLLAAAVAARSSVQPVNRNSQPIRLGAATLHFLNRPGRETGPFNEHQAVNNSSVVCKLSYGNRSILFTGDLESEGEEELLVSGLPLSASVLKIAHHGGKNSTSKRFLEAVRPEVAVITNDYPGLQGSPSPLVIQRLESAGAKIFWTGRDGAVTVETDGTDLVVRTGRRKPRL
jgi:competence protein ComEC